MRVLLILALLLPGAAVAQGAGTLAGRVTDDTGEGLPGANVIIDGTTLGAATDVEGNYRIIGVPVGTYGVTASFVGYTPARQADVEVRSGYTRTLDLALGPAPFVTGCPIIECFVPLVDTDPFTSRRVFRDGYCGSAVGFAHLPIRP